MTTIFATISTSKSHQASQLYSFPIIERTVGFNCIAGESIDVIRCKKNETLYPTLVQMALAWKCEHNNCITIMVIDDAFIVLRSNILAY